MKYLLAQLLSLIVFCSGFAQKTDSLTYNEPFKYKIQGLIVPATAIVAGTTVLLTEKRADLIEGKKGLGFGSYAEDYIAFAPTIANAAFDLGGMKSRTDGANKLAIGIKTGALNLATVTALQYLTKKNRPDGTDSRGFPSGHTVTAFTGATALSIEYGQNYPWVPYVAYGVASGVGALRVIHDKHYWSDVLVGAGIGILTSKLVYWTHQYRWKTKKPHDIFSGVFYSK